MKLSRSVIASSFAAIASGQTPYGTEPTTTVNLGVDYNGTLIVPGILLPSTAVALQPEVFTNQSYAASYMIFMLDQSIPDSDVTDTDTASLVPGLGANRTTRLHWWGGNYTLNDGVFVNSSDALAEYTSPRPREGDIAHTYVLYLLNQPADYTPPAEALNGTYYAQSAGTRFNFSLQAIADVVGAPLAANYFTSEWTNTTSS